MTPLTQDRRSPGSRLHLSTWRNAIAASLLLAATPVLAEEIPAGDLNVESTYSLGSPGTGQAPTSTLDYSNVSSFLGSGFINGGSALQGTNRITRLVADDILPLGAKAGVDVIQIVFSVANFNAVPVTARPRVRFWFDNGGVPGAYYNLPANVGFSFNPLAFGPGVTTVTGNLAPGLFSMPGVKFWAGITFDDFNGTTGATQAQMDNLGQGIFDPPDVGSSADLGFLTTGAGSFFGIANPAGAPFSLTTPPANFAWEFTTDVVSPTTKSTWGRIKNLYR